MPRDGWWWPRTILHRKVLRDLWHLRGPALGIAMVVMTGVTSFVAMRSMVPHLAGAQARYYREARFADLWVPVRRAPRTLHTTLTEIPGVAEVELRVAGDIVLDVPGLAEPASGHLIGAAVDEPPRINRLQIRQGRYLAPGHDNEVVISEGFARANALAPGDSLGAVIRGQWRSLRVVGIALTPEYVLELKPGDLFPDSRRYGILWMDDAVVSATFGFSGAWNEAVIRMAPSADATQRIAIQRTLDAALAPYGAFGAYGRDLQASHRFLSDEIRQARTFAALMPAIFLAVSALLTHLVLSRLVASQREQIGMLKAFGISTTALVQHYALIAIGPVIPGGLAGVALGHVGARQLAQLYARYYRMPDAPFEASPIIIMIATAIAIIAAIAGALSAVWRVARLPAAEAMRAEAPTQFRPGWLDRWRIISILPPMQRLVLRSLERRPIRATITMLDMALSIAVMMIGLFSFDAIVALRDIQFTEVQRDDIAVTFTSARTPNVLHSLRRLPGVLAIEPTWTVPVRVRHGVHSRQIGLTAYDPDANMRRVVDAGHQIAVAPVSGLLMSRALASWLRAGVGDSVDIDVLMGTRPSSRLPVAALVDDLIGTQAYLRPQQLQRLTGEHTVDGAVLRVTATDRSRVYDALKQLPGVAGVADRTAVLRNFDQLMAESFRVTLITLSVFAFTIAIGIVYNTTRIALAERGREMASLRVLGFTAREVAALLFGELTVLGMAAIPVGFMLGWLGCVAMSTSLSSELFRLPLVIQPRTYLWSTGCLVLAGLVSGALVRRRINSLDLIAVLKTRE